jgi:hypothetical protein
LAGCSGEPKLSSCELLDGFLAKSGSASLGATRENLSQLLKRLDDGKTDVEEVSDWLGNEDGHLWWAEDFAPEKTYKPQVDYVYYDGLPTSLDLQNKAIEACSAALGELNMVTAPKFEKYMHKFWDFNEADARSFEPCVERMKEASQEEDSALAEPILRKTLTSCVSVEAWSTALRMYPKAFGFDDTTGSELGLLCSLYSNEGICKPSS